MKILAGAGEIADFLKVSPRVAYRLIASEGLPVRKIGNAWTTTDRLLEGWIAGRKKSQ